MPETQPTRQTLKTDNGREIDVEWCGTSFDDRLAMSVRDTRPLSTIACEFEDGSNYIYYNPHIGFEQHYDGYTRLLSLSRANVDGTVQITLGKPGSIVRRI